ncbi:anaphase-promoting complex subunit 2-like isoform X2 [Gigantopelta aegis]|uniref:anaphase-promoting complex subunit 2-like isoform X2 n=1 Tax=Gigantopelta aegis TaxID=1735272 RepID=UPI001B88CB71|nr:anaphase-promoting complex subunit 2-like isoform X2 [Gigantopelta aegis]
MSQWRSEQATSYQWPESEFQCAVQVLQQHGLGHIIEEWFLENIQQDLRHRVAPQFWSSFDDKKLKTDEEKLKSCEKNEHLKSGDRLYEAVDYLHSVTMQTIPCIDRLEALRLQEESYGPPVSSKRILNIIITYYKAIIFFTVPHCFLACVERFYSEAFRVFQHSSSEDPDGEEDSPTCNGCGEDTDNCKCSTIMEKFHNVNRKLDEIGVLERISGTAVTSIVHHQIEQNIESTCKGNFEHSYIEALEKWLDTKVLGWLNIVYASSRSSSGPESISAFRDRLLHFLYETYAKTLIDQLFNIIIEFPESEPAIADLNICLEKTDFRTHLVTSLRAALESRLLHPGVNTADILTAYISAIRSLRALDPAGVILELVCEPVRKYLRSRDDTVRCIVSSLTDEGSNELLDELVKAQPLLLDEGLTSDDDTDDWQTWMPDPVDADPSSTSKSRRASDIISMLVNIYGSKELFVNEYRTLLADRILTHFNYDIERELRYLELLKLRFGETQLHYSEVMLKDVADSKRINSRIAEENEQLGVKENIDVNAMILSAQFWPAFREEKITLPEEMQHSLECFTKRFEALKGNRTLNWKPHLGLVNIDIELKDQVFSFSVSPVHAAIIMQFQNQDKWTVDELSTVLEMPASALRRKITYWQSQGLLKEEVPDMFMLVEEHKGHSQDVMIPDEDETESAMASAQEQREEELQVFWTYIVGMLTNLDCLPLERIHSMLRMFAMQGPSAGECSIHELKGFLDTKVKEQKLIYSGGVYRLSKST